MCGLWKSIASAEIEQVDKKIEAVGSKLDQDDLSDKRWDYYAGEKNMLREKENLLREKGNKLRDEKNKLRDEKFQLRDEAKQLREENADAVVITAPAASI